MGSATEAKTRKVRVTRRGGYEPGPKSAAELGPPPKTLGPGVKPKEDSPRRG
jgi:hypothetical protein